MTILLSNIKYLIKVLGFALFLYAFPAKASIFDKLLLRQSPFLQPNSSTDAFIDSIINSCDQDKFTKTAVYKDMMKKRLLWEFPLTPQNGIGQHFSANLFIQRHANKEMKSSPLTVISPGLFTPYDDQQASVIASYYYEIGHHVLVLPSPWSEDYVRNSNFEMGAIKTEATLLLGLLRNVQTALKNSKVLQKTHVLAYSYGSYLAAYASMLDAKSSHPTIDGKITLLSPPHDMKANLNVMDEVLTRYVPVANQTNPLKMLSLRNKLCGNNPSSVTGQGENKTIAAALIAKFIFKTGLDLAIKTYEKRIGNNAPFSSSHLPYSERKDFLKNLSFKTYVHQYYPNMFENYPEDTKITSFIKSSESRIPNRFRVIVATNDFINRKDSWSKENASYILKLGQGGHVMYIYNEWTKKMLQSLVK